MILKIWLDDIRPAPHSSYICCHSVNEVKAQLIELDSFDDDAYIILDLDHDLGDFAKDGGDGIDLMNWLEENKLFYDIRFHTQNPVGLANMRRVMRKYPNWREINFISK